MRLVRALKPFFTGTHSHQAGDPPVELDDKIAVELVKRGFAEFVAAMPPAPERGHAPEQAIDPAPGHAEQAVTGRQAKHGKQS
jgi:hypothetical protein